jgi:nucleoid DNA-binding protein
MNIQNHIKTLLYRHDCVIVSGLGGFICKFQSARIENDYVIPPSKQISFNQNLNTGDGLLENHLAKHEKISYQIAEQNILEFSQKIKNSLVSDQKVILNGLGTFKYNDNKNLVFEPDTSQEWFIEAYGLPKFKLTPITEDQQVENIISISDKADNHEKLAHKTNQSKPNFWRYAAIGIITIGIAGLVGGAKIYQDKLDEVETYNITQQDKANKLVEQKIQQSSFIFSEPLSPISVKVKEKASGKYHIVGGAFRVKSNVDKKIQQLQQKGFSARYIGVNAYGLHQVAYGSYSDKNEALKVLRKIKAEENPSAWLFVKEL